MGRLTVVAGTGTEIGKTHVCEALLVCLRARNLTAVGQKPIESGVSPSQPSDSERLAAVSSFHVKQRGFRFSAPISPHLAARRQGVAILLEDLAATAEEARLACDVLIVELPGGLFTPISDTSLNADFARRLAPNHLVLVAPDRLGVLHEIISTTKASYAEGLNVSAVVLNEPAVPDASTGTNYSELQMFLPDVLFVHAQRSTVDAAAASPAITTLASRLAT